jgi:hypothetical protein
MDTGEQAGIEVMAMISANDAFFQYEFALPAAAPVFTVSVHYAKIFYLRPLPGEMSGMKSSMPGRIEKRMISSAPRSAESPVRSGWSGFGRWRPHFPSREQL